MARPASPPPSFFLHHLHAKREGRRLRTHAYSDFFCCGPEWSAGELLQIEEWGGTKAAGEGGEERLHIRWDRSDARLETEDGDFSIPLLLANLTLGRDRSSGLPLIAITPSGAVGGPWLILLNVPMARAEEGMVLLGQAGAVRMDFAETYEFRGAPIGQGASGVIFTMVAKDGSRQPAENARLAGKLQKCKGVEEMRQELAMMACAQQHENVVRLVGFFAAGSSSRPDELDTVLAMERYALNLGTRVTESRVSASEIRNLLAGILAGIGHVHSCGILHRDVKPENILLAEEDRQRPVLADFGMACLFGDESQLSRRCGSPGYVAPEVISGGSYGREVDCFSAGCVFYFLHTTRPPFQGGTVRETLQKTVSARPNVDCPGFSELGSPGKDLLLQLLNKSPECRPSAASALAHDFLIHGEAGNSEAAAATSRGVGACRGGGNGQKRPQRSLPARAQRLGALMQQARAMVGRSASTSRGGGRCSPTGGQSGKKGLGGGGEAPPPKVSSPLAGSLQEKLPRAWGRPCAGVQVSPAERWSNFMPAS